MRSLSRHILMPCALVFAWTVSAAPSINDATKASNDFGVQLMRESSQADVHQSGSKNTMVSPISIYLALGSVVDPE